MLARWYKSLSKALEIIVNSLSSPLYAKYEAIVDTRDPHILWQDVITRQIARIKKGGTHYSNIRAEWEKMEFIPSIKIGPSYVSRLQLIKTRLAGDDNPSTDETVKNMLITLLPKSRTWTAIAIQLENNEKGLDEIVQELMDYQIRYKE